MGRNSCKRIEIHKYAPKDIYNFTKRKKDLLIVMSKISLHICMLTPMKSNLTISQ